jgi:hypothetical protein
MLSRTDKILADPGGVMGQYNFERTNGNYQGLVFQIFPNTATTMKLGKAFYGVKGNARDNEVTIIHETTHILGTNNWMTLVPEYYEQKSFGIPTSSALQNADSYGLFVYNLTH